MKDTSKVNNLKTKNLPPLFMMGGGAVALLICLVQKQPLLRTLIILFIVLLVFAILGNRGKEYSRSFQYDDALFGLF